MATVTGTPGTAISAQVTVADDGTPATEADQAVTAQSIVNDLATIKAGTYTTSATVTHTGVETFSNEVDITGKLRVTGSAARVIYRERILLTDAAHTIDVTQGDTFVLPNDPAAQRAITLDMTTGPPEIGERLRFIIPGLVDGLVSHEPYQFTRTRTPAGLVAKINSSTVITNLACFVEFEFAAGLNLVVIGTASGSGGKVQLHLDYPAGWGGLGNRTDSLATGDTVSVSSVGGTTEANGIHTITVDDASHITLDGTTFVHAWTSGGRAIISGGVWRLNESSGTSYDGTGQVGVLPDGAS